MALHGAALLIAAGRKAQRIARVIVHDGQRMAGPAAGESHAALEVHLPQQVGRLPPEPPIRLAGRPGRRFDAAMAA